MTMTAWLRTNAAWLAAAVGLASMIAVFYPGFMSPDSADQWLQARTGEYTSAHPPLMALTWSVMHRVIPGSGGLFVAHAFVFWFALAWLARELFSRPMPQVAFIAVIGCWPPVFGTIAHLWKDVPMLAFVLVAVAALAREQHRPRRWRWLVVATAALAIACAYRHNAVALVPPFAFLVAGRAGIRGMGRRLMAAAALTVAIAGVSTLPGLHPSVVERDVWPVTAAWDIAAVSIERDRMLIPRDWRAPDLSVAELRAAFQPWSNTTIFDTQKVRISIYSTLTPAQRDSLRRAWLTLWVDSPAQIIRHRLRLTALLFGWRPDTVPVGLTMWLKTVSLPGDPPVDIRPAAVRDWMVNMLYGMARTPLFAGWLYLLVVVIAAASAARSKRHALFWPMVTSIVLFCLPLTLFAPSAEFRYLLWPVVASLIVIALRFVAPMAYRVAAPSTSTGDTLPEIRP